jgi:hypothetical protein
VDEDRVITKHAKIVSPSQWLPISGHSATLKHTCVLVHPKNLKHCVHTFRCSQSHGAFRANIQKLIATNIHSN